MSWRCALLALLLFQTAGWSANRALLLGISRYNRPITPLPGIDLDIAAIKDLAMMLGFQPNEIKVLMNEQVTSQAVKSAVQTWIVPAAGEQDRVLIYYTGHGAYVKDTSGDEPDGQDELWVTIDTRVEGGRLRDGYLLDDDVEAMLAPIRSKHVLVLLDSCHSGSAARDVGVIPKAVDIPVEPKPTGTGAPRKNPDPNWVLFAAARDSETAGATAEGSLFTRNLVAAAKRRKAGNAPLLLKEWRDETERGILTATQTQHPELFGSMRLRSDNWFFGGRPPRPVPTGDPREILERTVTSAKRTIQVQIEGGAELKEGQPVRMNVKADAPGYLNIVNIGEGDAEITVLFPNKYVPGNGVEAGVVVLPSQQRNFKIVPRLPQGVNRQKISLYVFLSATPVNLYRSAMKDTTFVPFEAAGARALAAEAPEDGYAAAKVEFAILR